MILRRKRVHKLRILKAWELTWEYGEPKCKVQKQVWQP
jgi:hypothetical protein